MKKCSQCGKEKKNSEFTKKARNADGLDSKCKICRAKDTLRHRERCREELRVRSARVRAEQPEKIKADKASYYQRNKVKLRARAREWRKNNPLKKPDPAQRKNTLLKSKFGITLADYNAMLEEQKGVCAICGEVGAKSLHVDHCHTTGRIRGLLCFRCNNAIGQFKESETILLNAVAYIARHK